MLSDLNDNKDKHRLVILSERSESKALRTDLTNTVTIVGRSFDSISFRPG